MSLQPRWLPEVPAGTAGAAGAAFARGGLAIRIRDELGEVWSGQRFRGFFGVRGKPGISPAQLMIVLAMAMAENLTGPQAAGMVRRAIGWKYALGLGLEDPGFGFTVLREFRARLVAGSMETGALDVLLAALAVAYGSDGYRLLGRCTPRVRRHGCGSCPRSRRCAGSGYSSTTGSSMRTGRR